MAAVGLGPFPGVLAVMVFTATVLAKLYSEAIEAIEPGPVEAVRRRRHDAAGASLGRAAAAVPQFLSFTLYRFETKSGRPPSWASWSGRHRLLHPDLPAAPELSAAATVLLVLIGLVMMVDFASSRLRARLV